VEVIHTVAVVCYVEYLLVGDGVVTIVALIHVVGLLVSRTYEIVHVVDVAFDAPMSMSSTHRCAQTRRSSEGRYDIQHSKRCQCGETFYYSFQ
jgi:hypothetical protein